MDATAMSFQDGTFDIVISRSAMEHFTPVEGALSEMVRVVRPGGIVYLGIDPFFWIRGCHKRGVVDLPWAHARLSLDDYRRFVAETEGEALADERRLRLETLNRLTIRQWRSMMEDTGCEILEWVTDPSPLGKSMLVERPEIEQTLLPGVDREDLLSERVSVVLRKSER
jgi:ubiquinone/menaquinone biosynthesis C-methylase UbiE